MSPPTKSGFGRVVDVVEIVAAIAAVVFVVLLFANEPDTRDPVANQGTEDTLGQGGDVADPVVGPANGAAVYTLNCAQCHGNAGQGGVGPALADGRVVRGFPDVENQIAFVEAGGGGMPAFGDSLSEAEINAVVAYTREGL